MKILELLSESKKRFYTDQEDWEDNYPQDIGSAFEMWMSQEAKDKMWAEYQKGANFKSKSFEFSGDKDKFWNKVDKYLAAEKLKGWEEYDREENGDTTEFLLMKNK